MIAVLTELLQRPLFTQAGFDNTRAALLAQNQTARSNTTALARNTVAAALYPYPPSDPRATLSADAQEASLRAATPEQLRNFWKRFGSASVGELALIGPVSPSATAELLKLQFGDWATTEPHHPWVYSGATPTAGLATVHVADQANADYAARIPLTMTDASPEFPALLTGIAMLGGRAGGTALWSRLREQEGLSYSVFSRLSVPSAGRQVGDAATIDIAASYAPPNRDRLRDVIRDELARRAQSGFTALEVGFARRAIAASFKDDLNKLPRLAERLANNLRDGRDMHWVTYLQNAYDKLDAASVNAALRKYLDVQRMVEATAGSFAP